MENNFELELYADRTIVRQHEQMQIEANLKNLSSDSYHIITNKDLINFGIWYKDEKRYYNLDLLAAYKIIEKNAIETSAIRKSFKTKGEYCIGVLVKFSIIGINGGWRDDWMDLPKKDKVSISKHIFIDVT